MSSNKRIFIPASSVINPDHFNTVIYTGTGTTNAITGFGFQPDLIWVKNRDQSDSHAIVDSVRGITSPAIYIATDRTDAQFASTNMPTSVQSDGFTITGAGGRTNTNGENYVAWCFKAGGAAVSNTDGSITSQVSVNNDLGFSIVKFTAAGGTSTVGHGLNVSPEVVLMKRTSTTSDWYWFYNDGNNLLRVNTTAAATSDSTQDFTSTTFKDWAGSGNFIAYCFASKTGVSKIGTYTGTGTSGNIITTGFEPAFVMVKNVDDTGSWLMYDNARNAGGVMNEILYANLSNPEATASTATITPNSDGFTIGNSNSKHLNRSGNDFIYYAIGI